MLYLYAICERPDAPLPGMPGLEGAALAAIERQGIAAIVSPHSGRLTASAAALWCHEAVIEALMEERTALPARFGTLFTAPARVEAALRRAHAGLLRDFERLRGMVELGVRFFAPAGAGAPIQDLPGSEPSDSAPPGSGTAYLRRRLAEQRRRRAEDAARLKLVEPACRILAGGASAVRLGGVCEAEKGIAAAFLLPHGQIAVFRELVAGLAAASPQLAVLCTGPWPPYSFIGDALGAGGERQRHGQ